ncbi:hypothetical protein D9758_011023 [Tetrapyrgos nigripes]|uniref:Rap1 Myb domain-containing protein n=1 Tax=Tetrapyrgos nigripes TaxID=182062 RepID=A0A8H5GHE3_9AGAR|nr:hypothetical protein D9758_011023 [Tetrapyrgos nigripes]
MQKSVAAAPKRHRNRFTPADDQNLIKFLAENDVDESRRKGSKILYMALGTEPDQYPWASSHSWLSWRAYYRKNQTYFNRKIFTYQQDQAKTRAEIRTTASDSRLDPNAAVSVAQHNTEPSPSVLCITFAEFQRQMEASISAMAVDDANRREDNLPQAKHSTPSLSRPAASAERSTAIQSPLFSSSSPPFEKYLCQGRDTGTAMQLDAREDLLCVDEGSEEQSAAALDGVKAVSLGDRDNNNADSIPKFYDEEIEYADTPPPEPIPGSPSPPFNLIGRKDSEMDVDTEHSSHRAEIHMDAEMNEALDALDHDMDDGEWKEEMGLTATQWHDDGEGENALNSHGSADLPKPNVSAYDDSEFGLRLVDGDLNVDVYDGKVTNHQDASAQTDEEDEAPKLANGVCRCQNRAISRADTERREQEQAFLLLIVLLHQMIFGPSEATNDL